MGKGQAHGPLTPSLEPKGAPGSLPGFTQREKPSVSPYAREVLGPGELLACPPRHLFCFFYVGWEDLFPWVGLSSTAEGSGQDSDRGLQGNGERSKLGLLQDLVPDPATHVYVCFRRSGGRKEGKWRGMGPAGERLSWDWGKGPVKCSCTWPWS